MTASKTFCVLPWLHLHFNSSGDVLHCCIGDEPMGHLSEGSPDEIVNNKNFKDLRLKFLNNQEPKSCAKCFEREKHGVTSMRQHHNQHFKQNIQDLLANTNSDGSVNNFNFKYWDFRFSNLCNMKCRMCGHTFSSQWYDDEIELAKIQNRKFNLESRVINAQDKSKIDLEQWVKDKIHDVEYCYFAGGEPLIMDEHYYILEQLIAHNRHDVKIRYNTNLLKLHYKKYDLIDMWKFFDSVQINASIDDIDSRAEYIRKGTRWVEIENNLKSLKDSKVKILIECTTQAMNVLTIPDLYTRLDELGIKPYQILLHNLLQTPRSHTIKILDDDLKQQVKDSFESYLNTLEPYLREAVEPSFKTVIDYMQDMSNCEDVLELRKQFKIKQIRLDKIRNEDFRTVFPKLKDWYNAIPM